MIHEIYRTARLTLIVAAACFVSTSPAVSQPTAYVVNTLGQTLSKINLETGAVTNNIEPLGSDVGAAPNQVVVRDTLAYVINSSTSEIQIINLLSESTAGFIQLPPGSNPFHMAFYDDRFAYVTLLLANEIAKVDVLSRTVVFRKPVGLAPGPITIADHKAFVGITALDSTFAYQQGQLAIFDCVGDTLLQTMNVRTNPNALTVDGSGRLHLVCAGDFVSEFGWVYVFSTETDTLVDSLFLGGSPAAISIGVDDRAYVAAGGWVAAGEMYVYDAATLTIIHDSSNPKTVPRGCIAVSTFQDSTMFSVGFNDTVAVYDASGVAADSWVVGDGPVWVDFNYRPGDINGDWQISLADLTLLIDMLFISLQDPPLKWRANVTGDFEVSLADLTVMISYLFINPGLEPLKMGPTWID